MTPSVLRAGPYRVFFYSSDRGEPPHVHVARDNQLAKFWLDPLRLEESHGFARLELRRIERLLLEHRDRLLEQWDEYRQR